MLTERMPDPSEYPEGVDDPYYKRELELMYKLMQFRAENPKNYGQDLMLNQVPVVMTAEAVDTVEIKKENQVLRQDMSLLKGQIATLTAQMAAREKKVVIPKGKE